MSSGERMYFIRKGLSYFNCEQYEDYAKEVELELNVIASNRVFA